MGNASPLEDSIGDGDAYIFTKTTTREDLALRYGAWTPLRICSLSAYLTFHQIWGITDTAFWVFRALAASTLYTPSFTLAEDTGLSNQLATAIIATQMLINSTIASQRQLPWTMHYARHRRHGGRACLQRHATVDWERRMGSGTNTRLKGSGRQKTAFGYWA